MIYKSPCILEKIILDMPENKIDKIEVNDKHEYAYLFKVKCLSELELYEDSLNAYNEASKVLNDNENFLIF